MAIDNSDTKPINQATLLQWQFVNDSLNSQQLEAWGSLETKLDFTTASSSYVFAANAHKLVETQIIFALGYIEQQLRIALPLTIKPISNTQKSNCINFQCLQIISHDHLDFFVANGQQTFDTNNLLGSLVSACKKQLGGWHMLLARRWYFEQLPDDRYRSLSYVRKAAFYDIKDKTDIKQFVPKKLVKNLLRFERKLANNGEAIELVKHTTKKDVESSMADFLELESRGWKGEAGSAISKVRPLREFYENSWSSFAETGNAVVYLLKQEQRVIAAAIAYKNSDTLFLHKIAYDETLSAFSPGSIMIKHILEKQLLEKQLVKVSFNTNPPWIERWHPQLDELYAVQSFNNNIKGWLLKFFFRATDKLKLIKRSRKAKANGKQ